LPTDEFSAAATRIAQIGYWLLKTTVLRCFGVLHSAFRELNVFACQRPFVRGHAAHARGIASIH
jgi:hypothetical protein